ncbi:hypothetical protein BP5796_09644 [Coleophoma crateriformis]|uniref:DUF7728 domain-containing protein n=1 Tax=Coleophoma crateriformis TaxID=565419 RepID=A0A3D8QYR1_9HELO|nr:hypothetical protein BP5796_09644 [Coleophoma crateriformis]
MLHLAITVGLIAAGTQAFLIPPSISSTDTDIVNALPFEHAVEVDERTVDVKCPGCPIMASDLAGSPHLLQMDNELRLNFSIAHDNGDKLLLNGLQIYPLEAMQPWTDSLTAPQIVHVGKDASIAGYPKLGYQLSIEHPMPRTEVDQLDLFVVQLDILEVSNIFVNGVDSVELKLLTTPSNKMMIGDVNVVPALKPSLSVSNDNGKDCTSRICKWKAILADRLSRLQHGCGKKAGNSAHRGPKPHGHGKPRPHGFGGHHGAHSQHRHHRHKHTGLLHLLRQIAFHVLIPIAIGVMAGITASFVGMIAGHLVVFTWRLLFRRGCRGQYARLQHGSNVPVVAAEENKALIEHQGPPPVYEESPIYEQAVNCEKSDQ